MLLVNVMEKDMGMTEDTEKPDVQAEGKKFAIEMTSVAGKVVIVTGGTTGIGRATAGLLGSRGAKVVVTGRTESVMQKALQDFATTGGQFHGVIADSAYQEHIDRVFEETHTRFGSVNILINNAAIGGSSVMEMSYDDALYRLRINIMGYLWYIRRALEDMLGHGGGQIINVGSTSSFVRESRSDLYVAAKTATHGFNESFRKWLGQEGVRISLIEPGAVATELQGESNLAPQLVEVAEGKSIRAEDVAAAIYCVLTTAPMTNIIQLDVTPIRLAI